MLDMSKEIWKPVEGFEGLYEISNYGRVKSLARRIWQRGKGGTCYYHSKPEKILKPCLRIKKDREVYEIKLFKTDIIRIEKHYSLRNLVARHFIPNPDEHTSTIVLDGDVTNCRADNIEWVATCEIAKPCKEKYNSLNIDYINDIQDPPDMSKEIWKPVKGFEGLYEISNYGRVKAVKCKINQASKCGSYYEYSKQEKILKVYINKVPRDIHPRVNLKIGNQYKYINVRHMVALLFIPNPNGYLYTTSIDGNILNCRADNIQWVLWKSSKPDNEVWKYVKGFEGLYTVSNLGRIRMLDRELTVQREGQREYKTLIKGGKIKSARFANSENYNPSYEIGLTTADGILKTCTVAQVVARAFIPNPNGYKYVEHIDGNLLNNKVENLRWTHYTSGFRKSNEERKRPVKCQETGEVFESIKEAARAIGTQSIKISRNARGFPGYNSVKGYHFIFVDKEDAIDNIK